MYERRYFLCHVNDHGDSSVSCADGHVGDGPVSLLELTRMSSILDVVPRGVHEVRLAAREHRLQGRPEVAGTCVVRVARVLGECLDYVPPDYLVGLASRRIQVAVADIQDDKLRTEQRDGTRHVLEGRLVVDDS